MTDYSIAKDSFLVNFTKCNSNLTTYEKIIKNIKENDKINESHFITDITIENNELSFSFLCQRLRLSFDIRQKEEQIISVVVFSLLKNKENKEFFTMQISESYLINKEISLEIPFNENSTNLLLYCALNNLASKIKSNKII